MRRLTLFLPLLVLAACGPKTESLGQVGGTSGSVRWKKDY